MAYVQCFYFLSRMLTWTILHIPSSAGWTRNVNRWASLPVWLKWGWIWELWGSPTTQDYKLQVTDSPILGDTWPDYPDKGGKNSTWSDGSFCIAATEVCFVIALTCLAVYMTSEAIFVHLTLDWLRRMLSSTSAVLLNPSMMTTLAWMVWKPTF